MTAVVPILNAERRPILNSNGQWANRGGGDVSNVYTNGFSNRHVGSVSRLLLPASHAGFPVLIRRQHDDLRTTGNGGLVISGTDFQVASLSGVAYPFHIHRYVPTTGLLELIVYMPLVANQQNLFALYFGKENSILEDRAGSWGNKAIAVYHLPSGVDYSGNGNDMDGSATSGAEIIGASGSYAGTWQTRANVTQFNGKKNIYHSWWVKSDIGNTDNVPWALGQITGATPLYQRHDIAGSNSQAKCWSWGYIFSDGSVRFETKANRGSNTLLQHVACQIAPGAKPRMWINGVEEIADYLEPSNSGPWPTGGLAINNTTHDLWIGRGSVNSRLWQGLVDELRIIEDVKDTAYVATEYANLSNIDDFVIFGDTETPSTRSPRNELVTGTIPETETLRFAADQFLDNPTSDTPTLETITTPNRGQAIKVNDSLIDYRATGGDGLAAFRTTYEAAGKRVIAPVRIIVTPVTDDAEIPGEIPLPTTFTSTATVTGDSALSTAINAHSGIGYKLINLNNSNYGTRTITKDGIYLRATNLNGAVFTGELRLSGANNIISRCKTTKIIYLKGDNARAHRCFKDGDRTENGVQCDGRGNIVDGCEFQATAHGVTVNSSARSPIITRCWLHNQGEGAPGDKDGAIYIGIDRGDSLTKFNCDVSYCRIEDWSTAQRLEIKGSSVRVHHCHIVGGQAYVRHGLNNHFDFCWGDNALFGLCDDCDRDTFPPGSRVMKCVTTGTGNGSGAHMRRGTTTGDALRSGTTGYPYCEDGLIIAHTGQVILGHGNNGGTIMPKRTIIEVPGNITNIVKEQSSIPSPTTRALSITIPTEEPAKKLTPNVHCGQLWDTP